jgi:soluble lytic murein transglycosylase-like protein
MRRVGRFILRAWAAVLSASLAVSSFANNGGSLAGACHEQLEAAANWAGLPAHWVREVMRAESDGRRFAVSSAGAMGCMQLMPRTWAELSARYGLGRDPFHPRANMFGGAAYLRTMVDRFGWPAALAAYHAGPGRYEQYLARARPLPPETRAYVAMIATRTGAAATDTAKQTATADWRQASLFASLSSASRIMAHSEKDLPLAAAAN